MKRVVLSLLLLVIGIGGYAQNDRLPELPAENFNFMVASDMGRRGKSEQKNIAEIMGHFVEKNRIDFLAVAGDPIHDNGVRSVDDEEWKLKIENVYTAPSLHAIPWNVVAGNHEYNGNVQAVLDYSKVSERWHAPARYYSFTRKIGAGNNYCLFVFLDTTPLIDQYRNRADVGKQDMERELRWLDSVLMVSNARWKIVIGHHPVYAHTTKAAHERTDMQARVGTILENRGADFYICGHIHNFQHIKPEGKNVNYIVNSSASQSREVAPIEGTIFCNPDPGYSAFTISANSVLFFFVNHKGTTVYRQVIEK